MLIGLRIDSERSPRARDSRLDALVRDWPVLAQQFVCRGDPKSDLDPLAQCQDPHTGSWAALYHPGPGLMLWPCICTSEHICSHAELCAGICGMESSQIWLESVSQKVKP